MVEPRRQLIRQVHDRVEHQGHQPAQHLQSGEPGLSGWTVYLDANNNGVLDPGERNMQTLADDPETNLLGESTFAVGLGIQRRNPIVNDLRVRGSRIGSLGASGSYWVPARIDLDTSRDRRRGGVWNSPPASSALSSVSPPAC
jgi:hypothetical protein